MKTFSHCSPHTVLGHPESSKAILNVSSTSFSIDSFKSEMWGSSWPSHISLASYFVLVLFSYESV